ncbi:sensor domain-containing diguanylate cyclase [Phytohabitans rumicis]|uniref:GGDEF domain-containing protein n=1 Tax=Phytohabitans rumicis TaxID=1076125 RepID=A0A6V8LAR6_9ACTN|nr:sensor domain-containing diguanylate cyclase [Phytohabitans rumicis]GFJ94303.1 hypothetical protein Prum_079450 [Phytohabitans rumicis]
MARDPVLVALAGTALLATAWVLLGPAPDTVSWLVQTALDVVFFWLSWQIAGAPGIDRSVRRFWRGTAIGGIFFTLGDLVQTVLTFGGDEDTAASGTAQTVLVATGVACIVWVMLTHPIHATGRERLRLWLDAATVMCAAAVFAWYLSMSGDGPQTTTQIIVALVGSGLMLVSVFAMCKLLLSGSAPFTIQAGVAGVVSAGSMGIGMSLNSIVADSSHPELIMVARLLPCFLLAATPRIQQLQMRTNPSGLTLRKRQYSRLPYIAVGASQLLLIASLAGTGPGVRAWGVVLGVIGITALVVIRQSVAFTDNAQQEKRFRSIVQYASDIALVVDQSGRVTYASPAVERVLGITASATEGIDLRDLLHPDDRSVADRLGGQLSAHPRASATAQLRARRTDGSWRWLQLVATNLLDDASVAGVIVNARDVTEERHLQERLRYDATHDTLTRLANRALFDEQVHLVAAQAPHADTTMAILAIDLDDFKPVNDLLGHHVGDGLLVAVAERLRRCVLPTDTVARLGGDEFAVLLPATSHGVACSVAGQILNAFTEPVYVDGHELAIRASIGIAVGTGAHVDTLLRDADAAMYTVKHAGKGRYLSASSY